ncbi:MAG: zinc ribbon domain-containing protein [Ruminococcus sp.]|nr:zinc ribbon domain-containing protein [Ruminococcus sp.]
MLADYVESHLEDYTKYSNTMSVAEITLIVVVVLLLIVRILAYRLHKRTDKREREELEEAKRLEIEKSQKSTVCEKCGESLSKMGKFCPKCGAAYPETKAGDDALIEITDKLDALDKRKERQQIGMIISAVAYGFIVGIVAFTLI